MPTKKVLMKALEMMYEDLSCNMCPIEEGVQIGNRFYCNHKKTCCSSSWVNLMLEFAEKELKKGGG